MSVVLDRIPELLTLINAALDDADFPDRSDITVTSDGRDVQKAFTLEAGAVVIYPTPAIEWVAPKTTRLTWSIAVLASESGRTQEITSALYDGKVIRFGEKATPTDFKITDALTIPGYTITHIEEHRS